MMPVLRRILALTLIAALGMGLSACQPESKPRSTKTLKDVVEGPSKFDSKTIEARAMARLKDGGLHFKTKTIEGMRDPFALNRYICDGVERHLEDQFLRKQQFSNAFILKELGVLPETLQQSYATCFFEKGLKTMSLSAYFKDEKGFLAPQALAGYRAFAAGPQAKLLAKAIELQGQKPKSEAARKQIQGFMSELDKLWRAQDRKALIRKRGDFMRQRLDAGAWPVQ